MRLKIEELEEKVHHLEEDLHHGKEYEHKYKDLHKDYERCKEKLELEIKVSVDFKDKMYAWEHKH